METRFQTFVVLRLLDGVKGPLAMLRGVAALDAACALCWTPAFSDSRSRLRRDRSAWCRNRDHNRRVGRRNLRPAARVPSPSSRFTRAPRWHDARLLVSRGRALDELRTPVSCAKCAVPDRARSLRDVSRTSRRPTGWRRAAPLRRGGVPELSAVRLARRRVRAVSLWRLRPRPAGPVFM